MRVFELMVYAFVNTFGITQPTAAGAAKAARYVAVVVVLAVLVAIAVGVAIHGALLR